MIPHRGKRVNLQLNDVVSFRNPWLR